MSLKWRREKERHGDAPPVERSRACRRSAARLFLLIPSHSHSQAGGARRRWRGWGGWLPDLRWCSARQRDDGRMETGVWKAGCSVDRRGCGRRVQESGRQMWAAEPNFCLPRCGIRLPSPSHNPPSPSPAKPLCPSLLQGGLLLRG